MNLYNSKIRWASCKHFFKIVIQVFKKIPDNLPFLLVMMHNTHKASTKQAPTTICDGEIVKAAYPPKFATQPFFSFPMAVTVSLNCIHLSEFDPCL